MLITGGGKEVIIKLGKRIIDSEKKLERPYIIAEAGVNHEGNMDKAKLMIEQAADAGADAIKFQAYKAHLLASKYAPAYWDTSKEPTQNQFELFKKNDFFWKKEYEELANYASKKRIDFISTPFDFESADFLEPLVVAYKVASADIVNLPFLEHIAKKGKPVILSTGASTISEIWNAIETIEKNGNKDIILLHCILNYPTNYTDANLGMIVDMTRVFSEYIIGYSDHTLPDRMNTVLGTAWLLGAQVIEKHFTFDKSLKGNDHYHSMDKEDLKNFLDYLNDITAIIGKTKKHYIESETSSRLYARRSLVAKRFIPKGKIIDSEDIAIKRPGTGIPPYFYHIVIGAIATKDIQEDEIIKFGDFEVL